MPLLLLLLLLLAALVQVHCCRMQGIKALLLMMAVLEQLQAKLSWWKELWKRACQQQMPASMVR
jgi:hypothetical protein